LARFELGRNGEPVAILLRLTQPAPSPPPGWRSEAAAAALVLALGGTTAPSAQDLALLREAIPAGLREAGLRAEIGPSQVLVLLLLTED
jgi:hypothetical protein